MSANIWIVLLEQRQLFLELIEIVWPSSACHLWRITHHACLHTILGCHSNPNSNTSDFSACRRRSESVNLNKGYEDRFFLSHQRRRWQQGDSGGRPYMVWSHPNSVTLLSVTDHDRIYLCKRSDMQRGRICNRFFFDRSLRLSSCFSLVFFSFPAWVRV